MLAQEWRVGNEVIQAGHVIVDDHREQARSYSGRGCFKRYWSVCV